MEDSGDGQAAARLWRLRRFQEVLLLSLGAILALMLWHVLVHLRPGSLDTGGELVYHMTFSPDGRYLARCGSFGTAVFDAHDGRLVTAVDDAAVLAAFSPDGRLLATADREGAARVWSVPGGRLLATLVAGQMNPNPSKPSTGRMVWTIEAMAFGPEGRTLAAAKEKTAWLLDVETGKVLQELVHDTNVFAVAVSPDGRRVATGTAGAVPSDQTDIPKLAPGIISLWDADSGSQLWSKRTQEPSFINAAAFSPDGRTLVTAAGSGKVALWNADSGERGASMAGDRPSVFSHDGMILAVANFEGATLYDVATAEETSQLRLPKGLDHEVKSMAFSADDRQHLVATENGTVMVWDLTTHDLDSLVRRVTLPRVPVPTGLLAGFAAWLLLWIGAAGAVRRELGARNAKRGATEETDKEPAQDARGRSVHQVTAVGCLVVGCVLAVALATRYLTGGADINAALAIMGGASLAGLGVVVIGWIHYRQRSGLMVTFNVLAILAMLAVVGFGAVNLILAMAH